MEPLDAYTFPCPEIYLESYVGPDICLAMLSPVESSDFLSPTRYRWILGHSWLYLLSWK
jgi:hypothetical protein